MAEKHFIEQKEHTRNYLLPFLKDHLSDFQTFKVLEIGCAEAGLLAELTTQGFDAHGLELVPHRVKLAKNKNPKLSIFVGDITNKKILSIINQKFDLIIMRDVIEHIPDKETAIQNCKLLIKQNGFLYITFPPKYSPFAGHQQHGRTILKHCPYIQLVPKPLLRMIGKWLNENSNVIENIIKNFQFGLSINHFEHLLTQYHLKPIVKDLFLIRPIFRTRYGLKQRKFFHIPLIREVLTLGCEYLIQSLEQPKIKGC